MVEKKNTKNIEIIAAIVVILLIAVAAYAVMSQPKPISTTTTTVSPTTTTVSPTTTTISISQRLELPQKYLPSSTQYEFSYNFTPGSAWPSGNPGVLYTGLTFYKNASPVMSSLNAVMQVYSLVKKTNSTYSANQLFNEYKNEVLVTYKNDIMFTNITVLQLPQIGDETFGYLQANKTLGMNRFVIAFTSGDTYVKMNVFEPLNSTSTAPLINVSQGMLATLQGR